MEKKMNTKNKLIIFLMAALSIFSLPPFEARAENSNNLTPKPRASSPVNRDIAQALPQEIGTKLIMRVFGKLDEAGQSLLLMDGRRFLQTQTNPSIKELANRLSSKVEAANFLKKFKGDHPLIFSSDQMKSVSERIDRAIDERGTSNLSKHNPDVGLNEPLENKTKFKFFVQHVAKLDKGIAIIAVKFHNTYGIDLVDQNTCVNLSKKSTENAGLMFEEIEKMVDQLPSAQKENKECLLSTIAAASAKFVKTKLQGNNLAAKNLSEKCGLPSGIKPYIEKLAGIYGEEIPSNMEHICDR